MKVSGSRKGLVAPQNTFLDYVTKKYGLEDGSFLLASATIVDYPILYCNDGFSILTGFERLEVLHKSGVCNFMYCEKTEDDVIQRIKDALEKGKPDLLEGCFANKKKDQLWLNLEIAPVTNEKGVNSLFVIAFRDVTATRTSIEIEDQVQSTNRQRSGLLKWFRSRNAVPTSSPRARGGLDNPAFMSTNDTVIHISDELNQLNGGVRNRMEGAGLSKRLSMVDTHLQYKQEPPQTPGHILLHYSNMKCAWDWLILLLTGYTVIVVPYMAAFHYQTAEEISIHILDAVVNLLFFIDIVLSFHTTFVDATTGEVISEPRLIRNHYIKGWFLVDLLSCFPYEMLDGFQPTKSTVISILKTIHLLRVTRVTRKMDQYFEYTLASLALMIFGFALLAHWFACVWYSVTMGDVQQGILYGWLPRLVSDISGVSFRDNISSTVDNMPSKSMTYVTALYFTLSTITSIGFGNVSANTFGEKMVSIFFMLIGSLAYASIFGNMTSLLQQMHASRARYKEMLSSVKDFTKTHNVPADLSERVIDYVTASWAITKGIDTAKVLNYCPKDMQADLCVHLNRMVFNEHPAFRLASKSCLRALAVNFQILHTAPGDLIFHQGESVDQLCFVVSGSLEVIQDEEIVAILRKGDIFGEPMWKDRAHVSRSSATVRALTYCNLHCIKRDRLLQVLDFYLAFSNSFSRNIVLTYNLKNRLIFRKVIDQQREKELALKFNQQRAGSAVTPVEQQSMRRLIDILRRPNGIPNSSSSSSLADSSVATNRPQIGEASSPMDPQQDGQTPKSASSDGSMGATPTGGSLFTFSLRNDNSAVRMAFGKWSKLISANRERQGGGLGTINECSNEGEKQSSSQSNPTANADKGTESATGDAANAAPKTALGRWSKLVNASKQKEGNFLALLSALRDRPPEPPPEQPPPPPPPAEPKFPEKQHPTDEKAETSHSMSRLHSEESRKEDPPFSVISTCSTTSPSLDAEQLRALHRTSVEMSSRLESLQTSIDTLQNQMRQVLDLILSQHQPPGNSLATTCQAPLNNSSASSSSSAATTVSGSFYSQSGGPNTEVVSLAGEPVTARDADYNGAPGLRIEPGTLHTPPYGVFPPRELKKRLPGPFLSASSTSPVLDNEDFSG